MKSLALLPLSMFMLSGIGNAQDSPESKTSQIEMDAIERIEAVGGLVLRIAANDERLSIGFHYQGSSVTDKALAPLQKLRHIGHLNLAGTNVTDQGMVFLEGLTTLTRLHLEKTKITDAGLKHLKNLKSLSYLNLYGTAVSDAGLSHLRGLSNLKKLFLWQTKVTRKGVDGLQKALPNLEINTGWQLDEGSEAIEEEADE